MISVEHEACPGCGALLPRQSGPIHRYIGASAACWAIYTALANGGEPPITPTPFATLLVDAYAAQHPGIPSPQAIQSVAVHLLTLYGVLVRGVPPERALWLRQQALNERYSSRRNRFVWLPPPSFADTLSVAAIAQSATPGDRADLVQRYVAAVWTAWSSVYNDTVAAWYDQFIPYNESA